jgi:hypothetical protein
MPSYNSSPAVNVFPPLLQPGVTGYAFGSFDAKFPTSLMEIFLVMISGNTASIAVALREGKVPAVGSLITIRGTTTASGAFNVLNVPISTVSIDPGTGIGTITFILVHADVASNPDTGMAYVPVPEVGEALVAGASQAFAIQDIAGENENGLTINWSVYFPSQPSTSTITLQCADFDRDDQYITVDSTNSTSVDNRSYVGTRFRFVRMVASGISGGSNPSIVGRINI